MGKFLMIFARKFLNAPILTQIMYLYPKCWDMSPSNISYSFIGRVFFLDELLTNFNINNSGVA